MKRLNLKRLQHVRQLSLVAVLLLASSLATAETVHVAVAANFTAAANAIAEAFARERGHQALLSFGSTGKLYAQIANGAPFEVFLAADQARPARTVDKGLGVIGSQFTYARGRIVLYSADPALVDDHGTVLHHSDSFNRLAIANPKTAPYGAAAIEALGNLKLESLMRQKLVTGDNIAQTLQYVRTGNADLGLVAFAQVNAVTEGSYWALPESLYTPIRQDAVLLSRGTDNVAARDFVAFLQRPETQELIRGFGYGVGP